ncbi:hypothetical protein [Streptomyces cylindrosporus]|uniref:Uncharacterized protein n=1 Tax=Streptomyces cylindrosporus TaxID=2927583 RepID=A0ABS9YPK5_9ACTN|nr:hypothetical protein [Streptomyces cylindrosporus]MCI3279169.1 hypothetical protein [Streptomyces cylindrosporus]
MTARTRTAKKTTAEAAPAPVKKAAAARKTTAAASRRPASKRTPRKAAPGAPKLSLVKPRRELPVRDLPFMTDTQGYATFAARLVNIYTANIRDWRDHRDGTCTRRLRDGSTLHYNLTTRTLTWQAVCRMGATHQYELGSPSMACAARLHADACSELHADLSTVKPLTPDELEALGLLQTPTWARPDNLGGDITQTIPVPLPEQRERALADTLAHSSNATDETHPMSLDAIAEGLAQRAAAADGEEPKEHPEP